MPIIGGRTLGDRVVTQPRRQRPPFLLGQRIKDTFGAGLHGQDPFDSVERMRTEADGAIQGGQQVFAGVRAQQGQDLDGLALALTLVAQQAVEEALSDRPEFREAFAQQDLMLAWIGTGSVRLVLGTLSRLAPREEGMAGHLLDLWAMDDQFPLGDPHRQRLTDVPPRDRIEVLLVRHQAFDVDDAIGDDGQVVRGRGQRDQLRPFLRMPIDGPLLGLPMLPYVGDVGQPPSGYLIEVFQGTEGAAVEEALFDIIKRPFHFAFGLTAPDAARPGGVTVVGSKGEELGIIEWPFIAVPQYHHLEVVVQTGAGHTAQVFKRTHMLPEGGRQILGLDEVQVLPA